MTENKSQVLDELYVKAGNKSWLLVVTYWFDKSRFEVTQLSLNDPGKTESVFCGTHDAVRLILNEFVKDVEKLNPEVVVTVGS